MKLTPTIYNHYKLVANEAYMDMYHAILSQVIESEDLTQEEQEALTLDIMLSNVLGTVTTFDHVHALLKAPSTREIIADLETILDGIESDSYTADCILDLIAKLKK